jgi:predicted DNA-binding transcriptional regulator YafY
MLLTDANDHDVLQFEYTNKRGEHNKRLVRVLSTHGNYVNAMDLVKNAARNFNDDNAENVNRLGGKNLEVVKKVSQDFADIINNTTFEKIESLPDFADMVVVYKKPAPTTAIHGEYDDNSCVLTFVNTRGEDVVLSVNGGTNVEVNGKPIKSVKEFADTLYKHYN